MLVTAHTEPPAGVINVRWHHGAW